MALYRVHDEQHQGAVALVFEHPDGWHAESRVAWNYADTALPLRLWARAGGPHGSAFEILPVEAFYWLEPNLGMVREGTPSLGMVCMKPIPVSETFQRWVLPRLRPGASIQRCGPEPRLGAPTAPGFHENVFFRLDLGEHEELMVGQQVVRQAPGPGSVQFNWGLEKLYAFRAPKGQLDAALPTFWEMFASVTLNPAWQQLVQEIQRECNQRHQQLIQAGYAELAAQQQLGRAISEYVAHRSRTMQELFDMRWHSEERLQRGRGQSLSGTVTRVDPTCGTSDHSVSYQYVWSDGTRYRRTNDPFEDPNRDDPQGARWVQLPPVDP